MKRLLFVWAAANFSIFDVARGYRRALERTNQFDIRDYRLYARIRYHAKALGDERSENLDLLLRQASDNVVVEAMRHRADIVLIVSGLALHPDALWYLKRAGIPAAVIFTESPYDEERELEFRNVYPEMQCFTTERTTAARQGWPYLPHAYDPEIHHTVPIEKHEQDVMMLGTLWRDRISLFERVNWNGITVKFVGTWTAPPSPVESPIGQWYEGGCVPNEQTPRYYCATKINLNPHRAHPTAESLNPRTYELAACKAFQLVDQRAELHDVFGQNAVATFTSDTLEEQIRYWLDHPKERVERVEAAYRYVQPHTFDTRVETLVKYL